jgi:hypothetical protein
MSLTGEIRNADIIFVWKFHEMNPRGRLRRRLKDYFKIDFTKK